MLCQSDQPLIFCLCKCLSLLGNPGKLGQYEMLACTLKALPYQQLQSSRDPFINSKIWRESCACMQMSVADREQEIMSAAGLSTVGGTGTVGHGAMERALRIVPG